ncbi:MAG: hypothetical protein H7Y88_07225, partial [Phycisphaerales bacterium]|nr:hypothetical protein [Phycisphaerales bacterium]
NSASPVRQTLFRAEHAYDLSGNRLYDRVTQWSSPALHNGVSYVLDARSQIHAYDDLHRLTQSTVAQVDLTSPGAPVPVAGSVVREDLWWLDILGNWQPVAGMPPASLNTGRYSTGNLDGFDPGGGIAPIGGTSLLGGFTVWQDPAVAADLDPDNLQFAPITNGRNEVWAALFRTSILSDWDSNGVAIRHDAAGNLVFDGTLIYHYDPCGRLVQINAGAMGPEEDFIPGRPYTGLVHGPMLKHFTYDGLGRHVRTESPFPNPQSAAPGNVRSERFYYDGIRRIQETRLDPATTLRANPGSEMAVQGLGSSGPQQALAPVPAPLTRLVREYVWGPGDAWHPASVDELLCYYGEGREAYWPLQDASGDVAAVCAPGAQPQNYAARVVAQQRYDAYGQVLSADHLYPHAFLAVGHKGLFSDRLDRGVSDEAAMGTAKPPSSTTSETPRLVPFARGVHHVRNRSVIPGGGSASNIGRESMTQPSLGTWVLSQSGLSSGAAVHGRFMQADPNATAIVLVDGLVFHGQPFQPGVGQFDLQTRLRDGANLYEYLGSNPWVRADPLGLYEWEDAYEDATDILGLLDPLPGPSDFIGGMLRSLIEEYSSNLEWDLEWAGDWSIADDEHTRGDNSWVNVALLRGLYEAFEISFPFSDEEWNLLEPFASASGSYASGSAGSGRKRANLPSSKSVQVDIQHIIDRHTSGGKDAKNPGAKKDLWPDGLPPSAIERSVRNAYRFSRKVGSMQKGPDGAVRIKLRGTFNRRVIDMHLNINTKTIETAYPVGRI